MSRNKITVIYKRLGNEDSEIEFLNEMYNIGWEIVQSIDIIGYHKKPHLKKMIFKNIKK